MIDQHCFSKPSDICMHCCRHATEYFMGPSFTDEGPPLYEVCKDHHHHYMNNVMMYHITKDKYEALLRLRNERIVKLVLDE